MKNKVLSLPVFWAVLGTVQPPLHMLFFVLLRLAQGERTEELAGGFLTGTAVWALCAVVALLLAHRFPGARGIGVARALSIVGLALFGVLAALLFAAAAHGG